MSGRVVFDPAADSFYVRFPYAVEATRAVKAIPGAQYDGDTRTWKVSRGVAPELHRFLVAFRLDIAPTAMDVLVKEQARAATLTALSSAVHHDEDLLPDVPLRGYQTAGVAYIRRTRRCFVADEMGLGKTVTSLCAAEAESAWPAVVVCPASMKLVWRDELAKWLPHRTCQVLHGQTPGMLYEADLYVVNYDIVAYWLDSLKALPLLATILDEVQYVRNTGTARIKAVKKLTLKTKTGLVLGLTGTPLHLHTDNIRVQLEVLRRLDDFGGYKAFKARYSGNQNSVELHRRLRATCYLRRTKDMKEVSDELPAQMPPVRLVIEGTKAGMAEYRKAERDVAEWFANRARELALEMGEDPDGAAVAAKMKAESALHLVRIAALKRLAAKAKLPAVHEWIEDFLSGDKKLVVFAHHRDIVDELSEKHGALKIQGGMTGPQRHEAVRRFQEDPDVRMIVLSLSSGGVGLTLTAASTVLFVEVGWSPAEIDQAIGRCDRIGQTEAVAPYFAICEGTFDVETDALLQRRRAIMEAVVDGIEPTETDEGATEIVRLFRARTEGS